MDEVTSRGITRGAGDQLVQGGQTPAGRLVDQRAAIEVEQVEEEGSERHLASRARSTSSRLPKRLMVVWNGCGVPFGPERDDLAIEDELARRAAPGPAPPAPAPRR